MAAKAKSRKGRSDLSGMVSDIKSKVDELLDKITHFDSDKLDSISTKLQTLLDRVPAQSPPQRPTPSTDPGGSQRPEATAVQEAIAKARKDLDALRIQLTAKLNSPDSTEASASLLRLESEASSLKRKELQIKGSKTPALVVMLADIKTEHQKTLDRIKSLIPSFQPVLT